MKNIKQHFNATKQAGFTLVELIIVIVILGILSAFAIPKFIDVSQDARQAVVEGVYGALQSSANLVHAQAVVDGVEKSPTAQVRMADGSTVNTVYGYPAADTTGIGSALQSIPSGFTASGSGGTWHLSRTDSANCLIRYNQATATTAAQVIAVTACTSGSGGSDTGGSTGTGGTAVLVPPAENGSGVVSAS
ncbi:MAG: prepilin-type N-terminal cleavage/methylation domain-containing protein [Coxiellaceae bacterium]|nr:prepilin-type N-terminal cleavage/methylation domain-containing protein [Coxiellaceae bacterium]